jgi:hypothetical protein
MLLCRLAISFDILLNKKYKNQIQQWMDKFRTENTIGGFPWSSAIVEVPRGSVEKLRRAAETALHNFDKDNIMGKAFTEVFPDFPK